MATLLPLALYTHPCDLGVWDSNGKISFGCEVRWTISDVFSRVLGGRLACAHSQSLSNDLTCCAARSVLAETRHSM